MKKIKKRFVGIKGIFLFFIVLTFAFVIFYLVNIDIQERNIKKAVVKDVKNIQEGFNHLEESDIRMLSSVLDVIIQDSTIKEIYLKKDREKLYNHAQPLFQKLKGEYGITHWYFILPEGHTFLRVHNKDIYDDEITRFTFWQAKDTGKTGSGIELGKTAYALRVVMPYYNKGELIGYVELGQEIDHFLRILKEETGNEFILVADKEFLNREKWASVRKVAGLRDNWDDLEEHLIISLADIGEQELVLKCFTDENIEEGGRGRALFQEIKEKDNVYKCAGIPLIDASGAQSGVVLSLININSYNSFAKSSNLTILGFLVLIFILIVLVSYFVFRTKGGGG